MTTLRRVATTRGGAGFPHAEQGLESGELPFIKVSDFNHLGNERTITRCSNWVSRATAGRLGASIVPGGALLLPKVGAALLGNARRLTSQPSVFDNNVLAVVPQGIEPRYLHYWLSTVDAAAFAKPGPVPSMGDDALLDLVVPVEGTAEQRAIADYLDAETARIDALIAKKQQLIHLLEERWGQYVRRELRSAGRSVPLKRGWTVTDCKHRTPTYQSSGYPVVSPGDATPSRLDLARCHRFVDDDEFADLTGGGRRPQRGDIVYSRNASIGIACFVDTDEPFCMGQDVCLITSRTNDCLFLAYALNSLGVDQLEELKLGSTFSRVNISQILELEVPFPSPEQQRGAASRIDDRKRLHDRTIRTITRQVGLLADHRQALIAAAVNGEYTVALRH